jgi:hypothetical protein
MSLRFAIPILFALSATTALAQKQVTVEQQRQIAAAELEGVIIEAAKLDDRLAIVTVKARAAALISFADSARAETLFLQIWNFANGQTDKDFPKEKAKLQILKHLFIRNPKLARRLLAEQPKDSSAGSPSTGRDNDSRLPEKVASQLIDTDPSLAAALLEKSLKNPTPSSIYALNRLREKDSLLSDYIAAKVLDSLITQPTLRSLPALHLFSAYVFPGADAPVSSMDEQSSLQSLQFKYFVAAYEVLRASLAETNEALLRGPYTERDLKFRAAYQGQIAAILSALAPRFQPSSTTELAAIANKLASQVPPNVSEMSRFSLARLSGNQFSSENPEERFAFALSSGDFGEAREQLEALTDETKKKLYSQLLTKNEAKALLARSELMPALTKIRELEDRTTRLVMYLEALKTIKKKRDAEVRKIVINEAMLLIPQTERNGLHVRALLSFATQSAGGDTMDEAVEFLRGAITSLNHLETTEKPENEDRTMADETMAELNDPRSLLDAPEMEQAFVAIGLVDLDRGLAEAKRIENRSVQLVARLEVLQGFSKGNSLGSKGRPQSPKISSPPR